MRLIHTGDIHLDICCGQQGFPVRFSNRRRQSLRDVLCAILRRAAEWPADAVLIAGDLFDLEYVTRDTLAFLRAQFETIRPIPVFIAAGNHDPALPNSPYLAEEWPPNVTLFTKPEWQSFSVDDGGLVVHGFGFDAYEPVKNPWGQLAFNPDGAIHVAVGHGSERGHQPPDSKAYCPFSAKDIAVPGLSYVALGHFHAPVEIEAPDGTVMHYCGAPEGHDFSETGLRYYLEVEIDGERPKVRRVLSSKAVFTAYTVNCETFQSAQDLIEALRALGRASELPQCARVTLTGEIPYAISAELAAVHDAVAQDFQYLEIIDETDPQTDFDELAQMPTTLGVFARQINDEIADAVDDTRRAILMRAREIGIAAFRNQKLAVRGIDGDGGI
jgi:DNA repair exonuclease SbcCD nuclease subunit